MHILNNIDLGGAKIAKYYGTECSVIVKLIQGRLYVEID